MQYNFNQSPDLRSVHAIKWTFVPEDVLPMWVADMDFRSAQPIIDAIVERANFGTFGYTMDFPPLRETLVNHMKAQYDWDIKPEWLIFIPGMVTAINMITRAFGKPGDGVLMQTPVYHPFLLMPQHNQRFAQLVDLRYVPTSEHTFNYEQDLEAFERAITKQTSLFYLCNPHNPGGMIYSREELLTLAEICLRNNVMIVADEIHCDLVLDGKHIPIASLSPEIAQQTITLIAPSKTYNIAGMGFSIAIVPNDAHRKTLMDMVWGTGLHVDLLGFNATNAAYAHGGEWLAQVLDYLRANRDFLVGYVGENLTGVRTTVPSATYLAYLDFSQVPTPDNMPIDKYLMEHAKVALNAGNPFHNVNKATPRDSFVRLNFACPRSRLEEGLERIAKVLPK
jgi:cysteine-S-conjugate beta-lyase